MLYIIGTAREVGKLEAKLPDRVFSELVRGVAILDCEYGENRNYFESGGYSLVAETADDITAVRKYVDYEVHPGEWVTRIGLETGYISALYLMNDDYGIMVYMPLAVAPDAIIRDLEN